MSNLSGTIVNFVREAKVIAATPPLLLRYFDARGRAQFLRYYFACRGIAYTNEEVPLDPDFSRWAAIRGDRRRTGPFQKLPVLHWGEVALAETLVIQAFVHRQLGDEATLSAEDNLRHAMLVSSLYNDIMLPIGMLIWAEISHSGVDLAAFARRTLERLNGHWHTLTVTLSEWDWWARAAGRPVMLADCLLWEELSVMQHVFGGRFDLAVLPALAGFYGDFPGRTACEKVLAEKPRPVTGRPNEAEGIATLRRVLAS